MDVGRFLIRGVVGPLFVGHGTQKLFGWFGGQGLDGTGGVFEKLGLRPGKRHATAAGAAEATGGLLLTLGALTPLTATIISSTMITAIRKAHIQRGPWVTNGGYEYNLTLIAAMAMLTEAGPGRPSVDGALLPRFKGSGLAVVMLGAAALGSYLATDVFNEPEPAPAPQEGEVEAAGDPALDQQPRFEREGVEAPVDQTA